MAEELKPHIDELRRFQRHILLRQFTEGGIVPEPNVRMSNAIDAVIEAALARLNPPAASGGGEP